MDYENELERYERCEGRYDNYGGQDFWWRNDF